MNERACGHKVSLTRSSSRPLAYRMQAQRIGWMVVAACCISVQLAFAPSLLAQDRSQDGKEDRELEQLLPRLTPTAPADAAKSIRMLSGFRIELLAAEPMVSSPVDMQFDENGLLWVIEMIDYPYDKREGVPQQGRVRILEDTDGDGRPDRSFLFAEGIGWPTSLVFWDSGVFVAAAPHIYYLKDTNNDRVADKKEIAFTGFGASNVQALISNLRWGPGRWIYGQNGGNNGSVQSARKPELPPVSVEGHDFRFRPTGEFEAITGESGRFSNTFDDFGRRFTCGTTTPVRHIVLEDRLVRTNPHLPVPALVAHIAAEGSAGPVYPASPPEPWRVERTKMLLKGNIPNTVATIERGSRSNGFFTGATGLTVYRGTALGPDLYGTLFVGECSQNLIHRRTLVPVGSTFRADRVDATSEFLVSTDNWFRPVNLSNGPDGALYVCDMYRESIEHPWSIPEVIKKHLDLTSGKERGRLWRITRDTPPRWERPDLKKSDTAALIAALQRPDGWWRDTALRLLWEQQDVAAVPLLEKVLRHERPEVRVAALWALEGLGFNKGDILLKDSHAGVREQAVRLATIERLFDFDDADPRVRLELAARMAQSDDPRAVDVLARLVPDADSWRRTAIAAAARKRELELLRRFPADEIAYLLAFAIGNRGDKAEVTEAVQLSGGSVAILRGLAEGGSGAKLKLTDLPEAARIFQDAERTALDEKAPEEKRVEATRLLAYGNFDAAERVLRRLIETRVAPALRLVAVHALAARKEPEAGRILLLAWKTFTPNERRDALVWFSHPSRFGDLLDAVERGTIARDEIGPALRKPLLNHAELGARARAVLGDAVEGQRLAVIDTYRPALTKPGDVKRGHEVFRAQCATCHRLQSEGHEVGPNLAAVRAKSSEQLLESILDPNRLVEPEFLNYKAITLDGRIVEGLLASVNSSSVTLKRPQGESETVLRTQIETLISTGVSPMPENLEKTINLVQMSDLLAYLQQARTADAPPAFRAGAAKVRITPAEPGWLLCYDRHQKAEGVEAELWTRALALEDSAGHRSVLVSADILGFPPSLARSIRDDARRRFGLEDGQLLLSASHTHNGPVLPDVPSLEIYHNFTEAEAKPVHEYAKVLHDHVLKAIGDSLSKLRPARLSWARGRATFGINRRQRFNPKGLADPEVLVLEVDAQDGAPLATVFSYACHGTTTMADTCFLYHGDYMGVTATELERRRPGVTALYLAGCGGDVKSDPRGTLELVQTHGRALADSVEKALSGLRPIAGELSFAYREIELPLVKAPTAEQLEQRMSDKIPSRPRHSREMQRRLKKGPLAAAVPFPILAWRIGKDLTLVALSGETCVDYSLRLKRELGEQSTWIAGYANEVPCYIPSEHVLAEGGYEAGWDDQLGREVAAGSAFVYGLPAPFAAGIEDRICAAVRELLAKPRP